MWPDSGTPYLDMYLRDIKKRTTRKTSNHCLAVVHQETCPCCGRKLVNLYLNDVEYFVVEHNEVVRKTGREWRCKDCWDKKKGNDHVKTEEASSR